MKPLKHFFSLIIFLFFISPALAQGNVFHYQILTPQGEQGRLQYTIESLDTGFRVTSSLIDTHGTVRKNFELFTSGNWEPSLSYKWIQTPRGEALLESRYQGKTVELQLQAPWGTKKTRLHFSPPVFDFEEIPFLFSPLLRGEIKGGTVSIFIPVSGMFWKGKFQPREENGNEITLRFTLAGEVIILRYLKNHLMPEEMHFPQRGYTLLLQDITHGENQVLPPGQRKEGD
ncbi:MAG: hypothetical protein HPY68_02660 [Candidatus Atribacteria bacterium]|nr:hypothetical protein [Candidatus Atribacteria bacterium]